MGLKDLKQFYGHVEFRARKRLLHTCENAAGFFIHEKVPIMNAKLPTVGFYISPCGGIFH